MPEGPEILFFAVYLKNKFKNGILKDIYSFTDKPVKIPKDLGKPKIVDIKSKGKLFWFILKTPSDKIYYMHVHYGITGWIMFKEPEKNVKFQFVIEKNDKLYNLYLEDKRRFSKVGIYNEEEHVQKISKLGIDIFTPDFTLETFKDKIYKKNGLLASFLLKQDVFCGIGNYIKNETLYMGKLNVMIKSNALTEEQIEKLYKDILYVAYSNLLEQLREYNVEKYLDDIYKINMPKKLEIPYTYKVYGREITDDGKKITKVKLGGRDTYCVKGVNC